MDPMGKLFSAEEMEKIRASFYYLERDANGVERLFFDNAGGSFRLKKAEERFRCVDMIPDCSERHHEMAMQLQRIEQAGKDDIRTIFHVQGGSVVTALTASQVMFDMVRAVTEAVPGTNIVTTVLEHPSAYDSVVQYANRCGKEVRVAKSNLSTGGVDVEEIVSSIDEGTCLLNVMYASNISGAVYDIPAIVKRARQIKPDIFILIDAVQHAPHAVMDLSDLDIDGVSFAPYKFFGVRGVGVAWISERMARLPHHKLSGKPENEWELGSPAPAQYAMISEIVNYVASLAGNENGTRRERFVEGMTRIAEHERALLYSMLEGTDKQIGLRHMKGVHVFMDGPDLTKRDLIIGIGFDNIGHAAAVREYEKRGVIVYERVATSLYSARMLRSFGLDGCVRVSPLHCNTVAEIERFLAITQEMAALSPASGCRGLPEEG